MDISYCDTKCSIGIAAREECLKINNSSIDAALDFRYFCKNCFKTCPFKDKHGQESSEDEKD